MSKSIFFERILNSRSKLEPKLSQLICNFAFLCELSLVGLTVQKAEKGNISKVDAKRKHMVALVFGFPSSWCMMWHLWWSIFAEGIRSFWFFLNNPLIGLWLFKPILMHILWYYNNFEVNVLKKVFADLRWIVGKFLNFILFCLYWLERQRVDSYDNFVRQCEGSKEEMNLAWTC